MDGTIPIVLYLLYIFIASLFTVFFLWDIKDTLSDILDELRKGRGQ